jgi:hypothetical protein
MNQEKAQHHHRDGDQQGLDQAQANIAQLHASILSK